MKAAKSEAPAFAGDSSPPATENGGEARRQAPQRARRGRASAPPPIAETQSSAGGGALPGISGGKLVRMVLDVPQGTTLDGLIASLREARGAARGAPEVDLTLRGGAGRESCFVIMYREPRPLSAV